MKDTAALTGKQAIKLAKIEAARAREERLWALATDPTVKRLAMLAGIVSFSAWVNGHPKESGPVLNALAVALPTAGVPMLAAEAGISDWKVLAALALASGGIAFVTNKEAVDSVSISLPNDGPPVLSLLGPIAGLMWTKDRIAQLT